MAKTTQNPKAPAPKSTASKSTAPQSTTLKSTVVVTRVIPRLKAAYDQSIMPTLLKDLGLTNRLQVPRLKKVVVNVGLGEAITNAKLMDATVKEIALITGQRPMVTKAKKSIAFFKLRQGMSIGCKATLRGDRMYEFLDRLLNVVLPRIRDFRGVSPQAFDGHGNYTLGIKEQLIFPELRYDDVTVTHGMDITIVTTARTNSEGTALLRALGMPFRT